MAMATGLVTAPFVARAAPSDDGPTLQREIPVTPTDLTVTAANNSPAFAADPTDGRFVVAAHRFDSPEFGCGLQVSGNRGAGWVGANPVPELPDGVEHCYAPEVVFDRHGTLYYLFIGLAGPGNAPVGAFLTTSTDRARSFSVPWPVLGPERYMVRLGIDAEAGELGRLHLVWLEAGTDPPLGGLPPVDNPILSAYSDDGGRTFSEPVRVSDPERVRSVAPALAVGGGAVHVAYYDLHDDARDYQGLEGPTWPGTWSVVATSSSDGGATFSPGQVVDDQIRPPGRVMLVFTMPPPSLVAGPGGSLALAWPDARAGDPDVFASAAPDGRSWAPPVRLNDDTGRAATQELPRLGLAHDGRIDAAWLDRRDDADDRYAHVYYTWSGDGGRTFSPNLRVTAEPSDSRIGQGYRIPSAAGLVERGSRLAVLSRDASAIVAWPDTRNATVGTNQQDVFAAIVAWDDGGGGPAWLVPVALAGSVVVVATVVVGFPRARRWRRVE